MLGAKQCRPQSSPSTSCERLGTIAMGEVARDLTEAAEDRRGESLLIMCLFQRLCWAPSRLDPCASSRSPAKIYAYGMDEDTIVSLPLHSEKSHASECRTPSSSKKGPRKSLPEKRRHSVFRLPRLAID